MKLTKIENEKENENGIGRWKVSDIGLGYDFAALLIEESYKGGCKLYVAGNASLGGLEGKAVQPLSFEPTTGAEPPKIKSVKCGLAFVVASQSKPAGLLNLFRNFAQKQLCRQFILANKLQFEF